MNLKRMMMRRGLKRGQRRGKARVRKKKRKKGTKKKRTKRRRRRLNSRTHPPREARPEREGPVRSCEGLRAMQGQSAKRAKWSLECF